MEYDPIVSPQALTTGAIAAIKPRAPTVGDVRSGFAGRALDVDPSYWFAMFAASALGTNLGDFWVDWLIRDRLLSFVSLAFICVLAIWQDRRAARCNDLAYWLAIVALRAAATNVADYLTHDLGFGYLTMTIMLGMIAVLCARSTVPDPSRWKAPKVDRWYWIAMLFAGLFGTVGGDLASHTAGLYAASGALCGSFILLIAARSAFSPASVLLYWCIILAERCAGTAVGDALASDRAIGLGLPLAIACTGGLFVVGLLARVRRQQRRPG